jgi:hypothetical protein
VRFKFKQTRLRRAERVPWRYSNTCTTSEAEIQRVLARDAQGKRDAMYARQVHEAAIAAAGNVTRLRSA